MDAKGLLNAMIATVAEYRREMRFRTSGDYSRMKLAGMTEMTVKAWMLTYDMDEDQAETHVIERIEDVYLSLITD